MNCEEATNLISARLDGELDAESIAPLDAHLAGCEECRRTQAELEIQDASLVRAFGPYQESAIAVANRVTASVSAAAPQAGRLKRVFGRVAALAAAAAVGFVAAIFYLNAHHHDRVVIAPSSVIRDITPARSSHARPMSRHGRSYRRTIRSRRALPYGRPMHPSVNCNCPVDHACD
jgi:anti-sigma factor RsiW